MAVSQNGIQIQFAGANFDSVAFGANSTSDEFNLAKDAYQAQITLKVDNDGTPAAGDTMDFFLILTSGDPDGTGADEFDTVGVSLFLAQLDTNDADPTIKTIQIPTGSKGGKLHIVNNSGGRAITGSAEIFQTLSGA